MLCRSVAGTGVEGLAAVGDICVNCEVLAASASCLLRVRTIQIRSVLYSEDGILSERSNAPLTDIVAVGTQAVLTDSMRRSSQPRTAVYSFT